ncbi:MAG: ATP-binding protein [Chitinophagaceae bacterium]
MKKTLLFWTILCLSITINAQSDLADSFRKELEKNNDDNIRFKYNNLMYYRYAWTNPDSAIPYVQQNILIGRRLKSDSVLSFSLCQYGLLFQFKGNFPQALHYSFEALKVAEKTKQFVLIGLAYFTLTEAYLAQDDYIRALFYATRGKSVFDKHFAFSLASVQKSDTLETYKNILSKLAVAYEKNVQLDSALKYIQITEQLDKVLKNGKMIWDHVPFVYGNIYFRKGEYRKAIRYYRWGMELGTRGNYNIGIMNNAYGLANAFKKINSPDSGIFYANKVMEVSRYAKYPQVQLEALTLLADVYKGKDNTDSTAKYFELALAMKDSLFNRGKVLQMQNQTFNEQVRQQELQEAEQKRLYQYRMYAMVAGLGVLAIIALLLYRTNQHKQKANLKIEKAYEELKSTQAQLIQSAKMASLGELTAGIAHEIQNPLNFVNNFSEVNKELIDEMEQEMGKGNLDDAKAIAKNIKGNEEKIIHHGKRAEAIVKGMLQHSQTSNGQKELTDINKLADEYLRLSSHGLRAKDNSFNATMNTDFDDSIGKINIVPQDIGRVLLNLYNNAFYAVSERKKKQPDNYEPTVTISTRAISSPPTGGGRSVEIKVIDNGGGIPQKVVDKIFQPFFTTKPTGQGTGLGLSLSYDIVKAHGGEIKVETKAEKGTVFTVQLPV